MTWWEYLIDHSPAILAAIGTIVNAFYARSLKVHINSRMTEFLEKSEELARHRGHAAGIAEERKRNRRATDPR